MLVWLRLAALLLAMVLAPVGALAEKRVALVIGNAAYPSAPLGNPGHDVDAMAQALTQARFDVVTGKDLSRIAMSRALEDFQQQASGADIAIIFYSGHGIEVGGTDYLVPTDATLATDRDAKFEAIPLDDVLEALEGATKLKLVLLDACRDNPLAEKMKHVATKGVRTKGLGRAEPNTSNMIIGFATAPGQVAFDGEGENSPFTAALIKELPTPGLDVELALRRVRDDVIAATRDIAARTNRAPQEPYNTGSIGGEELPLVPAKPAPATAMPIEPVAPLPPTGPNPDEVAQSLTTATSQQIAALIEKYQSSPFLPLWKKRLRELAAMSRPAAPTTSTVATAVPVPAMLTPPPATVKLTPPAPGGSAPAAAALTAPVGGPASPTVPGLDATTWSAIEPGATAQQIVMLTQAFPSSPLVPVWQKRLAELAAPAPAKPVPATAMPIEPVAPPAPMGPDSDGMAQSLTSAMASQVAALTPPPAPVVGGPCGGVTLASLSRRAVGPLTHEEECALKPKDEFRECKDCPAMVVVPPGTFSMGSPASEPDRADDEGPQHKVTLRSKFAVGKFDVTFEEWDACVAARGCNGYSPADQGWGRGRRPVIDVSWSDAQAYVAWLSRTTGEAYRLLSESEWEYAARAGTTTAYPWGAKIGKNNANCHGCGSRWDGKGTAPVGSFAANRFGLYDMAGNVFQWVEDCDHETYAGAPTDGSARTTEDCSRRVLRGGSWVLNPRFLRAADRIRVVPTTRSVILGFRVARTLTP